MKFIRLIKAEDKRPVSKITQDREGNNDIGLWFEVQIVFSSEKSAIYFRQHITNDERVTIYDDNALWLPSYLKQDELSERMYLYSDKYPLNQIAFKFDAHVKGYEKPSKNIKQNYFELLRFEKEELIKVLKSYDNNADIKVEVIPPQMKTYDYKDKNYLEMNERVDTLFEGLSTAEIRNYDFVIVGKDKAEAKAIETQYLSRYIYNWDDNRRRRERVDDMYEYTTKDQLRSRDWYKPQEMAYIKTVSDELDNGIYCLTTKARKYFKDYFGKQNTLIPVYDAKASQLGGKVVIAKKNNFIRVLKAGYEWDYENDCEIRQWNERCDATFMTEDGKEKHKYFTVTLDEDDDTYYYINELDDTASSEKEMFEMITKKCEDLAERKGWKFISLSNLYL